MAKSTSNCTLAAQPEAPYACDFCPRLAAFVAAQRTKEPTWFNGPVPSFGDPNARLLIVGLAPGLKGANRTGRPFTGDFAGDLLYATLNKFGFSKGKFDARPDDGLTLRDCLLTNAVRCVPPENKPTPCRNQHLPPISIRAHRRPAAHPRSSRPRPHRARKRATRFRRKTQRASLRPRSQTRLERQLDAVR